MEYIFSSWGILSNIIIALIFGLAAYNTYAKRWSAKSGRYFTKGRITWSEIIPGSKNALISYTYSVEGLPYNGKLYVPPFTQEKTIKNNPKGKEITVYYSNKSPEFSRAYKPPNHFQIIFATIIQYLIVPAIFINFISGYLFWLASANH